MSGRLPNENGTEQHLCVLFTDCIGTFCPVERPLSRFCPVYRSNCAVYGPKCGPINAEAFHHTPPHNFSNLVLKRRRYQ
jgi:hypothetical protein